MRLLVLGLLVSLGAISEAGPARGGVHGGGFHAGFVGHAVVNRGAFQARYATARGWSGVRNWNGVRRGFGERRFFGRNRFAQQYAWPVYWYPGYYPYDDLAYSDLEPDAQPDYQYWDNSAAYQQQQSAYAQQQPAYQAVPQSPVILVVNNGNARPTDLTGVTGPGGDGRDVGNGYGYNGGFGQQRTEAPGDPVVPQAPPVPQPTVKTPVTTGTGPFKKYVVVSYLNDRGKDVISVKNTETNDVQRITSQPNIDHFRIVEIHPNPDQRQFEAIISNGTDQGPVRFQF